MSAVPTTLATLVAERTRVPVERLDAVRWTRDPVGWEVHGHRFAYRTTDPALDAELDRLFGDLRPLSSDEVRASGTVLYSLPEYAPDRRNGWAVFRDDERLRSGQVPTGVVSTMAWRCNREVIAAIHEPRLSLHAGVVARGGRAVVLAAPQESGKTTLTTGLLRRGLDYLTDEAAAIDRGSLQLAAYPKALSIDRGSWPLFPELEPTGPPAAFVRDQWHVRAGTVGSGAVVAHATPAVLLTPRYAQGGPTRLVEVGPAEMVRSLAESTFHLPEHAVPDLRALARLVERCPYRRLEVGDLEAACDLVLELLESTP